MQEAKKNSVIQSNYQPTFTSADSALRVLRRGKSNPNWKAAADYLYERSKPEVKLLIEAQLQIKAGIYKKNTKRRLNKNWLLGLAILAGVAIFTSLLIWIFANAVIRQC